MAEEVILVDASDDEVGVMEKIAAHREGRLHRAFSVFVFSSDGRWLLQQRAPGKYHSELLWTNTCCSHPRPGEETLVAARRRLKEEMGFTCDLTEIGSLTYEVRFDNGLGEHEFDHLFSGVWEGTPNPDPTEAAGWRWVTASDLQKELREYPEHFTHWFQLASKNILAERASAK